MKSKNESRVTMGDTTFPISIGDRIYTTGDVCNPSGWAVVDTIHINRWGVTFDASYEKETLGGYGAAIADRAIRVEMTAFCGLRNKFDRWQTEAEYNAYRAAALNGAG